MIREWERREMYTYVKMGDRQRERRYVENGSKIIIVKV